MTEKQQYVIEVVVFDHICDHEDTDLLLYKQDKLGYIDQYMALNGREAMIKNGCEPGFGPLTWDDLGKIAQTIDEWIAFRFRMKEGKHD